MTHPISGVSHDRLGLGWGYNMGSNFCVRIKKANSLVKSVTLVSVVTHRPLPLFDIIVIILKACVFFNVFIGMILQEAVD